MAGPRVLFLSGTGVDHEVAAAVARLLERREPVEVIVERARDRIDARAHAQAMLDATIPELLIPQPFVATPPPRFVPGKRKRWRRSQRSGR